MLGSNRPGHIFQRAGEVYQVCSQSVSITGILRSVESGEEIVKLEFRRNKKWKRIEVDRGILASPQKIIELYKQGFSVTSQNAKAIVAFLQDMLDRGIENGTIPVSLVTSKWDGRKTNQHLSLIQMRKSCSMTRGNLDNCQKLWNRR